MKENFVRKVNSTASPCPTTPACMTSSGRSLPSVSSQARFRRASPLGGGQGWGFSFRITIRNLRRNLSYSAINIAGLAIGITASVFIFTWVYHERSFDKFYPDADRIYRVFNTVGFGEGDPWIFEPSPYPLALAIGRDIPEVESTAMMYSQMIEGIRIGDEVFSVGLSGAYVNKAWLEMFDYKLVDGSFDAFGSHPFSVVLTGSEAAKYFGKSRAVGQTISINNTDYAVQAVVKDNPSNSSFQYNIMASADAVLKEKAQFGKQDWSFHNAITFVKLRPGTDAAQVCTKMNDILAGNKEQNNTTAYMRPLADIHFETGENYYITHGNQRMVSIFSLLGILLLCTACINYVNLATAKANTRVKEIGVKKIIGARRIALFGQFIVESFLFSLVAAIVSLMLVWMLYPPYRLLAGGVDLSLSSPVVWAILGIILVATTALNGIYPALMLSSFQPMNFLKGMGFLKMKDSNLRKGLVVFQFTLSAALVVSVMVIYSQMQYVRNMDPGYNHEQVLVMPVPNKAIRALGQEKVALALQSVKGELQSNPAITGVAVCDQDVANIGSLISGSADWDGRAGDFNPNLRVMAVDTDYGQLLGMKLAEGRWFSDDNAADETNVILNETAIRELHIREPYIGQRFDLMGMKGSIIGVVKDFHFRSLHEKISPLALYHSFFTGGSYRVTMKTQAGKHAEAVQAAKSVWKQFFPNDPFEYAFLDDAFNNLYQSDTRTSRLMLIFSVLSVVIAVLGLFGLSTFAIERRTKEIGIRKILGASVAGIINMLTKEFLWLVIIAFAIAVPIAWWAMNHWLSDFAYRINFSVWIFVAGGVLTLVIALIAVGAQAVKAATANPVKAIKAE